MSAVAQVPAFDKLEQLYDQGRYQLVYRKSVRLLNKPEYDYSLFPAYYQAIAALQLLRSEGWRNKHSETIDLSFDFLKELGKTEKGTKLKVNHGQELVSLQADLNDWIGEMSRDKENKLVRIYSPSIRALNAMLRTETTELAGTAWEAPVGLLGKEQAVAMIAYAQDLIGTPFCIAVDHQSLEDNTVTIRYRDTTTQERISIADLKAKLVKETSFNTVLSLV